MTSIVAVLAESFDMIAILCVDHDRRWWGNILRSIGVIECPISVSLESRDVDDRMYFEGGWKLELVSYWRDDLDDLVRTMVSSGQLLLGVMS
jgi:hypothetical protein